MNVFNAHVNRKHKDRLFRLIFGEDPDKLLQLYNALNGTNYTDSSEIEITTLEDAIYLHMKNDVSILIDSYIAAFEQQSTYNPNMPLRGFLYFSELYAAYIELHDCKIHSKSLVKIPSPQYTILYTGEPRNAPVETLRLSDAFEHPIPPGAFEWTATMYNLNHEQNRALVEGCKPLWEYMMFLNRIKENQQAGLPLKEAVNNAILSCIEDNILADFLIKQRSEVMHSVLTEFDEKKYERGIREEGREEGRLEGLEEGEQRLASLLQTLSSQGRFDDLQLAINDSKARERFYVEFKI